jgi:hypothetical protein
MRAYLDEGEPFLDVNPDVRQDREPLLISLLKIFSVQHYGSFQIHGKVNLVLQRGADVKVQWYGDTCLHIVFSFSVVHRHSWYYYDQQIFKDTLMSLVTAGADINAYDKSLGTLSEIVCKHGHEEIWLEVLAECGYDIEPVLATLKNYQEYQRYPGMGCFPVVLPPVRLIKLSFAEYCEQRKLLECVRHADSFESLNDRIKTFKFLELLEEYSDSEDYELRSDGMKSDDSDDDESNGEHESEDKAQHESSNDGYHWENNTIMDIKNEFYGGVDYRFVWWNVAKRRLWRVMDDQEDEGDGDEDPWYGSSESDDDDEGSWYGSGESDDDDEGSLYGNSESDDA